MFCPKCGTQLPDEAEFCSSCGSNLKKRATTVSPKSKPSKTETSDPAASKFNTRWIIVAVCAVILIVVLILCLKKSGFLQTIQEKSVSQTADEGPTESDTLTEDINDGSATGLQSDAQTDVVVSTPTPLPSTPTPSPSDSTNEETVEKEPPFAEGFPSQIIYEEDGVSMTFVGFAPDFSTMTLRFENNNPDNKKASFWNLLYSLDGVWDGELSHNEEIVDMLAGESEEFEVELEKTVLKRYEVYSMLGAPEFPLEMASFFFEFRVGSDSDRQFLSCPIYFDAYKEGDLEQYYGEKIATIGTGFDPNYEKKFDLYTKMDGDKAIAVFANQRGEGDTAYLPTNNWSINTKGIYEGRFTAEIIGEGFISVTTFEKNQLGPDYRRKNEIPDGTPLDVSIYFQIGLNDYEYPVGTFE